MDIAVEFDIEQDRVVLHRTDCPQLRRLADCGHPVMTMLECQRVPSQLPRHECLDLRAN